MIPAPFEMRLPHDIVPLALLALATLATVGAIVLLGELLRRGILALLAAVLPAPGAEAAQAPVGGAQLPAASRTAPGSGPVADLDPGA